jgi:hypothetical protein
LEPLKLDAKRRYAAVLPYLSAAARKTRPDPYFDIDSILAKVSELFDKAVKKSDSLDVNKGFEVVETALDAVGTAVEWSEYIQAIEHFSALAMEYFQYLNVPVQLILIGAICVLVGTTIELGDNILHYTTAAKLLLATLKFAVAVFAVYLVFHISGALHLLSLILMTGILILSVASGSS